MTPRRSRGRIAAIAALSVLLLAVAGPPAAAASRPSPQIIGGEPTGTAEYPFMAAILNETISGTDWDKQFCGGSLVSREWVLTAAHCVEGTSPSTLAVAIGRTTLASDQGQRRAVIEVHVHPDFGSPDTYSHDAALLRLAAPVSGIAPIRLAGTADDAFEADGTILTVIGWGNTATKGQPVYPDDLREVDVPVVSDSRCASAYGASLDPVTMLCAGTQGKDSCQGDSGGPLFATTSTAPVQMGIVSWGNGCAKKRFPGVYSEVNASAIRSWVTSVSGA